MLGKIVPVVAFAALVAAQQGAYQQCGGIDYPGDTTCASGLYCSAINSYYMECVAGTATPTTTAAPTTAPATTTSVKKTTKKTTSKKSTTKKTTKKTTSTKTTPVGPTGTGTPVTVTGNPFAGKQIYANPYYASEVISIAVPSLAATDAALAAKASEVAKVGTFSWLDVVAKVPTMATYLSDIRAKNAAGASPEIIAAFVVYDLPDRDCAADASNGEFSIANNGVANYKGYIDAIKAQVEAFPDVQIAFIVEPDSLANLVTNLSVAKCANAEAAYKECVTYAIQQLNLPSVSMYLDAGHAGWLGWSANIGPAATLFGDLYTAAGSPSQVRGLATNVANYNAWSIATAPSYTQGDANYDEEHYVTALAPLLTAAGYPAHFVMDVSRNGVQPTAQQAWGDWCNVKGTGFGVRPTADTGNALEDAFLWIKPGGECDGTSNTTAARYDPHCGLADALQPAPEAGTWFQAYFAQLLTNANPSF